MKYNRDRKYPKEFVDTFLIDLENYNDIKIILENNFPLYALWEEVNEFAEMHGFVMEDFDKAKLDEGELIIEIKKTFIEYIKDKLKDITLDS